MSCHIDVEHAVGNIFVRPVCGTTRPHTHHFDHMTLCIQEPVHVRIELPSGETHEKDLTVGEYVHVPAEAMHTIRAEGGKALCIYAHRNPQGEVVQEFTGWTTAYAAKDVR